MWRVDVGRVPLLLLDADRPENAPAARWITVAALRRRPRGRASRSTSLLGVGGVRALRGDRHRARRRAPQRGPRRVRLRSSSPRGDRRGARRRRAGRARERTVFTTHTPVPAGNDTYPADQVARRARPLAGELGHRRRRARPPRPHAPRRRRTSRSASPSSRCAPAAPPTASAAATARSRARCGTTCGRDRAVDDVPITPRHQRRPPADLDRRPDARAARPPPRRGLARPRRPTRRPGRRVDAHPRRRAVGRAQRAARASSSTTCASAASIDRLGRDEHARVRRARPPTRFDPDVAHDRLRPPPGHLQAARPAAQRPPTALRRCWRGDRPVQLLIAGKAHPRDDEGKRLVQRLFGSKDAPEAAAASSSSTTTTSRCARALIARLRRLGQRPAPAAGGERHVRHEVRRSRRSSSPTCRSPPAAGAAR